MNKHYKRSLKHLTCLIVLFFVTSFHHEVRAQSQKIELSPTNNIKFFASAQMWLRHTNLNPESTVQGTLKKHVTDISIRRFRLGLAGHVTEKLFIKFQLGTNNLNYLSSSSTLRILDLEAFYSLSKYLTLGGGKTGYVGLSRYAAPASAAALGFDLPFFAMTTVGITDEILRRPSLAAKGHIGKLHYTAVIARQQKTATSYSLSTDATFQQTYQQPQYSMYLKYQFFDKDKDTSAFLPGTYYGTKKILTLGIGFEYQADALQGLVSMDTISYDMFHFAVDLFIDMPLNSTNTKSFTFYTGYFNYNFGKNYIRNVGINNTADGTVNGSYNGAGNSFPASGTGQVHYTQTGFRQVLNNKKGTLAPFVSLQIGDFDKLDDLMVMYDFGIGYLFNGHKNKLTLGIQSRPIFDNNTNGDLVSIDRKNMYVVQYQIKI